MPSPRRYDPLRPPPFAACRPSKAQDLLQSIYIGHNYIGHNFIGCLQAVEGPGPASEPHGRQPRSLKGGLHSYDLYSYGLYSYGPV